MSAALTLTNLTVELGPKENRLQVVRGVSLELTAGRIQGLAGESGSGKTVTAMAVLGLLPASARVTGSARVGEVELFRLGMRQLNRVRGRRIAMIFQDPSASLHPQITIGSQLTDHVRHHLQMKKKEAYAHAAGLLTRVQISDPQEALRRYPHQFSGGQRQRIAIAMALACDPEILLADEPTTALDVTVQAGILHLLRELVNERNLAVLLVTHDLGVMSAVADDVSIMRHGRLVESGSREQIFTDPQQPYTRQLLDAMPDAQESEIS